MPVREVNVPVVNCAVVPLVVVPVKEVNVPVVKAAVTPVVVVPVSEVNVPVVNCAVVPLVTPLTVNPETMVAFPCVNVSPENVKFPPKVWPAANKV